jgi:predicted nucleic acid-binding protein
VKGWLLDTNVIAEISGAKPDRKVEKWVNSQPEHTLFLSILTIAEYQKGIEHLSPGDKLRPRLQQAVVALETRFSGRILSVSDQIALRWGSISGEVKRLTGHPPSVIDTMLAATAIEHSLYLATRNVADVARSGAEIFNPWKDDPIHFSLSNTPQRRS